MLYQDSSARYLVPECSVGEPDGLDLQRRDVHPIEEANGFRALLNLEDPKYSIEQISAKTGKSPVYVASRLKLTELTQNVVDAFYREEIGVGHALLLAKLQPGQQEQALAACFKEDWSAGGQRAKRILLPVRSLQFWIESNVLLILKLAPFDKRDGQLVPAAGSCVDCPMRTGHNKLLFSDLGKLDACKLCGIWATASLSCWLLVAAPSA
jgi:ParB family chromosome partitioning protein